MRVVPVDVARILVAQAMGGPEPVLNADGEPKVNRDGQRLFTVPVAVAVVDGGASVVRVKVAGEPPRVAAGMPVSFVGLVAVPWEVGGRHGLSFSASAVRPAPAAPPPSPSARAER